jgi:hypothetical protein
MPELEPQFVNAGYVLIEGFARAEFMSKEILPELIYSVSPCICELHPPMELISWVKGDSLDTYQKQLELSDEVFLEAMFEIETLFEKNGFGWNSVFSELETAKSFAMKYFKKIENLKLFQIVVPSQLVEKILKETNETTVVQHGVHSVIKKEEFLDLKTTDLLGYEVIGYDMGRFHSFICNSLETRFKTELEVQFNTQGYITSLEDALKAADYCNLESTGAEDGYWFPVGMREIPINMVKS